MVESQCAACGKVLKFNNLQEFGQALAKSGPEMECAECQQAEGGGAEDVRN